MATDEIVKHFRETAALALGFLEDLGFQRDVSAEVTAPTGASVVYLGKHVGFILGLDIRDRCVDAHVVKVVNGKVVRSLDGGFSSGLYTYLVKHAGYRGGVRPNGSCSSDYIERMIQGWADVLKGPGKVLLADSSTTLPER